MTDLTQPDPFASTVEPKKRWSGLAIAAFIVAIIITVVLLTLKTVSTVWTFSDNAGDYDSGSLTFGGLLLGGIVIDLVCVVLAHIAIVETRGGARAGRILAAVALGAGYVHVLLWANRIVNAAIASFSSDGVSGFVANNFWWA